MSVLPLGFDATLRHKRTSGADFEDPSPSKRRNVHHPSCSSVVPPSFDPSSTYGTPPPEEDMSEAQALTDDGTPTLAKPMSTRRLDKGKGKSKVMKELPEVIWSRIFEHYYDRECEVWDRDTVHRNNLTPLVLSRETNPIALRVLYRHPHLSYHHLKPFAQSVKLPQPGSEAPRTCLVRHLTIRASRLKPLKASPAEGLPSIEFYTINTFLKDVCMLFTDLTSITIKDTLLLNSADANLLFESLKMLRPKKARLEIRCWDLSDSLLGRDLIAASAINVHGDHTYQIITPSGAPDRPNQNLESETRWMQGNWKAALLCGGEVQLPAWWIESGGTDTAPPVRANANGTYLNMSLGAVQSGLRTLRGLSATGSANSLNATMASVSINNRGPNASRARSGLVSPSTHSTGVIGNPSQDVGESSTRSQGIPGREPSSPTRSGQAPPALALMPNRLDAERGAAHDTEEIGPTTGWTREARMLYNAYPAGDISRNTKLYTTIRALEPNLAPEPSRDRASVWAAYRPAIQVNALNVAVGSTTQAEPDVASAQTSRTGTLRTSIPPATEGSDTDAEDLPVSVLPTESQLPSVPSSVLTRSRRVDHTFATDEDLEEHERQLNRDTVAREDSSLEIEESSAKVPRPRGTSGSEVDDKWDAHLDPEMVQQRVRITLDRYSSSVLAHEIRRHLFDLLQTWTPNSEAFSFVALDPLASLIVRDPLLTFWVRLPIPHIRVHLPRGVHSLAVFKGSKENTTERRLAIRRQNRADDSTHSSAQAISSTAADRWEDRIVGGDGTGGGLLHEQTRLFEIEVNTVSEMVDERDWILRGEQLPSQACRILVGSSDWRDVIPGYMAFSSPEDLSLHGPASPSSSQFPSPTFSFVDLDDSDDEMISGEEGECYDREAALEQKRRFGRR